MARILFLAQLQNDSKVTCGNAVVNLANFIEAPDDDDLVLKVLTFSSLRELLFHKLSLFFCDKFHGTNIDQLYIFH